MLRLLCGNSADLFRVSGSEELVVAFCLRGVSAVFNGLLSGRSYSAAKLTAVALACSGSGSGLNLGMPIVCDDVRALPFGWLYGNRPADKYMRCPPPVHMLVAQ